MKATKDTLTKPSETEKVNAYMKALKIFVEGLRQIILSTDHEIGKEIKWNAPAFFCTGAMKPFNPKKYKRHSAVFNLYRKGCIRHRVPQRR